MIALRGRASLPMVGGMKTHRGFTLTEALVTLAILSVLLGVAVPSIAGLFHGLRLQALSADLFQHLLLARSEAIKRNGRVVLCKTADGQACTQEGGWDQGWLLFHDANRSGTREENEPVLERLPPLPAGWRLTANRPLASYVSYGPLGGAKLVPGGFQAGTFTLCRASLEQLEGRQIVLNAGGRPRVQKVWLPSCY
jgi:type IV fimbrial biogenesis protein FimT